METRHPVTSRAALVFLVLVAAFHPLVLWNYGFEIADTGWAVLLMRDFSTRPDLIQTSAPWYLSWAIGHFFQEISGQKSWIAIRQAGFIPFLVPVLAVLMIGRITKSNRLEMAFGLCCTSLLSYSAFSLYQLNYNSISLALSIVAICLIIVGSSHANWIIRSASLFAAGALVSFATSSRLPSILTVIPILFYIITSDYKKSFFKSISVLFLGFVGGVAAILLLTWYFGHTKHYMTGLLDFMSGVVAGSGHTSHAGSSIVMIWIQTCLRVLIYTCIITVALLFVLQVIKRFKKFKIPALILVWTGLTLATWRGGVAGSIPLLQSLPLVAVAIAFADQKGIQNPYANSSKRVILTGLVFAATFSFGSTNGFMISLAAYWLVLPFIFDVMTTKDGKTIALLVLSSILTVSSYQAINPYWDQRVDRLQCKFKIPGVLGIISQCERVRETEEVVGFILENSSQTDKIFIAQSSPALYVLAGRSVWGSFPWPYLRSSQDMKNLLSKEYAEYPKLVVLDRLNVFNSKWPAGERQEPIQHVTQSKEHFPIYLDFLTRQNYVQVYGNNTWKVYAQVQPPSAAKGAVGH